MKLLVICAALLGVATTFPGAFSHVWIAKASQAVEGVPLTSQL